MRPGGREGGGDEVGRDHLVALLREVHGVDPFAATEVERSPGRAPSLDGLLQQSWGLLPVPRQRLDARGAPVEAGEHELLEVHARSGSLVTAGAAGRWCGRAYAPVLP